MSPVVSGLENPEVECTVKSFCVFREVVPIRVPTDARSERVFPSKLAGTVENHRFESRVLAGNPWDDPAVRELPVYLPPSGTTKGRPLLVLLTGYTGYGAIHFERAKFLRSTIVHRLDHLIRTGAAPEAVLMAPDCLTTLGGSQYLNSSATGRYEDYVVQELVPFVQRQYGTGPCAVLGTSSGGYGAVVLALRHPELFPAAGSDSGDMYFEYCYLPDIPPAFRALRQAGGPEALLRRLFSEPLRDFRPSHPDLQALELMAYASAYSPSVDRPGEFELPFDLNDGSIREDVWARWLAWDPVRMIRTPAYSAALRRLSCLFVDGGDRDEYGLDVGARIFATLATAQGGRVEHEEFSGGHWDAVPRYDAMIPHLLRALEPP